TPVAWRLETFRGLMASAVDPERLGDLLAGEGPARLSRHVRDHPAIGDVVDDLPQDRLSRADVRAQELAAQVRDPHVAFVDHQEAEELRGIEDGAQAIDVHLDFLGNLRDVGHAADLVDRLHQAEDLAYGYFGDGMKIGQHARPPIVIAAIRHLTSSNHTINE